MIHCTDVEFKQPQIEKMKAYVKLKICPWCVGFSSNIYSIRCHWGRLGTLSYSHSFIPILVTAQQNSILLDDETCMIQPLEPTFGSLCLTRRLKMVSNHSIVRPMSDNQRKLLKPNSYLTPKQ